MNGSTRGSAVGLKEVPDVLHLCDRCGQLASGGCETCAALTEKAAAHAQWLLDRGEPLPAFGPPSGRPLLDGWDRLLRREFARQKVERDLALTWQDLRRSLRRCAEGALIFGGAALSAMLMGLVLWELLRAVCRLGLWVSGGMR